MSVDASCAGASLAASQAPRSALEPKEDDETTLLAASPPSVSPPTKSSPKASLRLPPDAGLRLEKDPVHALRRRQGLSSGGGHHHPEESDTREAVELP